MTESEKMNVELCCSSTSLAEATNLAAVSIMYTAAAVFKYGDGVVANGWVYAVALLCVSAYMMFSMIPHYRQAADKVKQTVSTGDEMMAIIDHALGVYRWMRVAMASVVAAGSVVVGEWPAGVAIGLLFGCAVSWLYGRHADILLSMRSELVEAAVERKGIKL